MGDTPTLAHPDSGTPTEQWAATARLIAGRARVRVGSRGRRNGAWTVDYPARGERPLTSVLPLSGPAAVLVYGDDGCCQTLCLDLDLNERSPEQLEAEAANLTRWLTECGARVFTDLSPAGGRHIYLPMRERVAYDTAREVVEALARLFPAIDPGPHRSVDSGCIRTPGSLHKAGGHQQLTTSLSAAYDALKRPNGPDVLQAIQIRLRPQLDALRTERRTDVVADDVDDQRHQSDSPAGRISARILQIARAGVYDTARYPSPSEARAAVMAAAARARLTFTDVVARIEDGRWRGLAALYAHHSDRRRRISRDWHAASTFISRSTAPSPQVRPHDDLGNSTVRNSNTSKPSSQGGRTTQPPGPAVHQLIRTWRAALYLTEQHHFPGRRGYAVRWVLRALGGFAHAKASTELAVGTRALAVASGLDHSTVSLALKVAERAGWVIRVAAARGEKADMWALALPSDLAERAPTLRWDRGKSHSLRPAFRELGHVAGFVFEAIELGRADTITTVVETTGISRSAVHDAIDTLSAWALVERTPAGTLRAHPELLPQVAEHLGAQVTVQAQIAAYAQQRHTWRAYLHRFDPEAAPADPLSAIEDAWWTPPPDPNTEWTILDATTYARAG
ncbi:hypothetical protein ACFQ80_05645 [Isoptericola sp. NPDC056578]|uniref:MarR family transcriptional regulator n=1 Tax=Isoptericola sp. NPDC056578 TaxID=3345870 RepID=UPI00367987C3